MTPTIKEQIEYIRKLLVYKNGALNSIPKKGETNTTAQYRFQLNQEIDMLTAIKETLEKQ